MSLVARTETGLAAPLAAVFIEARTALAFGDGPVTEAQLRRLHELARFGPTAFNGQPLRVSYLRQGAARERLAGHLTERNRDKALAAPLTAILSVDTAWHERLAEVFAHAPAVRDRLAADPAERRRTGWENAHVQAGYYLLAARAAGLAVGPMGGFDRAGVDREFFPAGTRESFLVVNLGHPLPGAWREPRLPRLGYDDVVEVLG
ncbi:malonic semialdehyde reductase [Arthrobacter sp. I2-34]|uniref:Malonic semialdehyde reductase n=1 Tax=Arthrobacter hankyongi TaxID=2904801 RepID=A0ABS9L8N3_9MICC|nr:malonic semialdehyde reductase [Arthrobacter hankyongi]MCG2623041.1 malonic semialdehyde reductase [Arthrobacter hankyongi]